MMSILLVFLLKMAFGRLFIEKPESLKNQLEFNGVRGGLDYSMSTFGAVPYEEEDEIQVLLPSSDNIYGCSQLKHPQAKGRFVFIVKRGECTYSSKAY